MTNPDKLLKFWDLLAACQNRGFLLQARRHLSLSFYSFQNSKQSWNVRRERRNSSFVLRMVLICWLPGCFLTGCLFFSLLWMIESFQDWHNYLIAISQLCCFMVSSSFPPCWEQNSVIVAVKTLQRSNSIQTGCPKFSARVLRGKRTFWWFICQNTRRKIKTMWGIIFTTGTKETRQIFLKVPQQTVNLG